MTETLDNQNAEVLPAVDESAVVQAALQNQLIARGDHLMPGEHGGFSIERLSDDHLRQPVTYGFAFGWGDGALAEQFAESYMEGTTPVVRVEDAQTEKRLPGIVVTFPVSESKYREAVSQGKVADGLFDADCKAAGVQPGTEALDALVGKESMRQSLKKAYSDVTGKAYLHEMAEIDYSAAKLLPNISEAFDFMDTDEQRQMRLLNFSETSLSDEQLGQLTNVIRSYSEKTAGEVFERLETIMIVPEGNPLLTLQAEDAEGGFALPTMAGSRLTMIFISERALKSPEDREPWSDRVQQFWKQYYEKQLLPGEPSEGPGSPYYNASRGDLEYIFAHEIAHAALKAEGDHEDIPGTGPTLYSRVDQREFGAELAALAYKGCEEALAVSEEQRAAMEKKWQRALDSQDYAAQQLGPRFIRCKEIDLSKGPLPRRMKDPNKPLPAQITYMLSPDEQ